MEQFRGVMIKRNISNSHENGMTWPISRWYGAVKYGTLHCEKMM